jgi:hypothetical protein
LPSDAAACILEIHGFDDQESFQGLGSDLLLVFPGSLEGRSGSKRPEMLPMGGYPAMTAPFLEPAKPRFIGCSTVPKSRSVL